MKKGKAFAAVLAAALYLLVAAAAAALVFGAVGFRRNAPTTAELTRVETALVSVDGGEWRETRLPCVLSGLEPETPVSLTAAIYPGPDDGVFIQSDYAPASVRFDGALRFEMGKPENYPRFMKQPGREVHVIEAFGDGGRVDLRVDYRSPGDGGALVLHRPMVGSTKVTLMERTERFGVSLVLSLVQVVTGAFMILISAYVSAIDRKGLLFLWLGVFSLLTGLYFLGGNDAAAALFPQTALIYLASFVGLFAAPAALFRFVRESIEFKNARPVRLLEGFFALAALAGMLLQLCGAVPLHKSALPLFALLLAATLFLIALVIREYRLTRNIDARRFILPLSVLAASDIPGLVAILRPLNRAAFGLCQAGVLLFLLIIGALVGIYVKDSLDLQQQMTRLSYEENLVRIQSEEQRNLAMHLVRNEEMLSRQRHDLRHHLTVIGELAESGNRGLLDYLSGVMKQIPKARERFCENSVVNAVISHFSGICENQGIDFAHNLTVPETGDSAVNSSLCVIFSNLLENAVEACGRMTEGEKFIRLKSSLSSGLLTVTMDNSFNGEVAECGGRFRSAKRDGFGIGLSSVAAIARKARGDIKFEPDGKTFRSSVYLSIEPPE